MVAAACWAQNLAEDFIQTGNATHDLTSQGLTAAHPSLPIGSKPIVKNLITGKEVEVTIVGRIPSSNSRIIDVSKDAAEELGITTGGYVSVYFFNTITENLLPPPLPPPLITVVTEPAPTHEEPKQPTNITLHTYIVIPEQAQSEPPPINITIQKDPQAEEPQFPHKYVPPGPGRPEFPFSTDPNSGIYYKLQVGAFAVPSNASAAYQKLRNAGFEASQEQYGNLYRISVAGVPAHMVHTTAQRLYAIGFTDIWIRK